MIIKVSRERGFVQALRSESAEDPPLQTGISNTSSHVRITNTAHNTKCLTLEPINTAYNSNYLPIVALLYITKPDISLEETMRRTYT